MANGFGDPNLLLSLVGLEYRARPEDGSTADEMAFYRRFFSLAPLVASHGLPNPQSQVTRIVRYEADLEDGRHLVFMGVGVPAAAPVPEGHGLTRWTLGEDWWQAQAACGERSRATAQIAWAWRDDNEAATTGDFYVLRPAQEGDNPLGEVRITANAYRDFGREYAGGDAVALFPYDPAWAREYEWFASWLREYLGPAIALDLEHIGSTAIPGMPAKPIIDVLLEVPADEHQVRRLVIPRLNALEWEYWWYGDHMMFIKRAGFMGTRTHHVHLAPRGSRLWERVAFRDYLRTHPDVAAAYAALKMDLASSHESDREAYTQAKGDFVRDVTAKALAERSSGS